MAANDVKVTLTADDQATEIVRRLASAVKQLDAQQRTANQGTASAASAAKSAEGAFSGFQKAIAGVAAALGAIRVIEFVRDTIEATDQIGKLAQKTGASTEALSVLAVAASTADLGQQELGDGLKFLSRSLTELNGNVPKSVQAFAALGLSAKDLKGLSLDQVLVKIADAQDKFGDGAGKAAALMAIFGRNGTALIPLLHDLANGGFDQAAQKAKDLGLVISSDAANAARDFDDAVTTLKNSFKGLVVAMTPAIKATADLVTGIANLVARHGDLIGFASAAIGVGVAISSITKAVVALQAAVAAGGVLGLLNPGTAVIAAFSLLATTIGFVVLKLIEAHNAKKALEEPLKSDPTLDKALGISPSQKPQVNLQDAAQQKALIDAQIAAVKQAAKDELSAAQQGINAQQQAFQAAYQQGLLSLGEYFDQRVVLTRRGVAAQVAELEAQKQALTAAPLAENTDAARTQRASELLSLENQIAVVKRKGETDVLQLVAQEIEAKKQLQAELEAFAQQVANATGNTIGAQQVAIEAAARRYREVLSQVDGLTQDTINAQVNAFSSLLTTRAAFEEKQRQGERVLADLALRRQAIQAQADQGIISQRDAELQIAALEQSRIPALKEAADLMAAFAQQAGDPALIQTANQFRAQFENIGKIVDQSTIKLANLRETLLGEVQSDLSQFLGDTLAHVNSLADAFRQLALSIVSSFQRVLGDIIATKAVEAIRGLIEGSASAAPQVAAATATGAAATALSAAGTVIVGGATGITAASGALSASGGILLTAAGALTAAAAALAAAGAENLIAHGVGAFAGVFASGGPVFGPGTGTSDSIVARLSHGEYVIRADAVRKWGVSFFDALNGFRMPSLVRPAFGAAPGFASGGFVSAEPAGATVGGGIDITVGVDDGAVIKAFSTRGGVKALQTIVGKHPQAFKAALGIP